MYVHVTVLLSFIHVCISMMSLQSSEWNTRNRTQTEPVFIRPAGGVAVLPTHPHHRPSSPPQPFTSSLTAAPTSGVVTDMDRSLLPPLPGEPNATWAVIQALVCAVLVSTFGFFIFCCSSGWRTANVHPHDRRGHTMPRTWASFILHFFHLTASLLTPSLPPSLPSCVPYI